MTEEVKPVDALRIADLEAYPVWQYTGCDDPDETYVRPVKRLPVRNLNNKVVGTRVLLANGRRV